MKDFDALRTNREQQDRTFKLSGRDFRFRAATRPEETAELFDWLDGFTPAMPQVEATALCDRAIKRLLEPESAPLWDEVRAEDDPPVTQNEILAIIAHILEVQTGRPILQLDGSGGTPSSTGTTPTDRSDSPAGSASLRSVSASS